MNRLIREAFSQESISPCLKVVAFRLFIGVHTNPKFIRVLCEVAKALFFDSQVEVLYKTARKSNHSN